MLELRRELNAGSFGVGHSSEGQGTGPRWSRNQRYLARIGINLVPQKDRKGYIGYNCVLNE